MTMFATLARYTEAGAVHVSIFPAGEGRLRAIIAQKLDDDSDAKPLNLSVTGTPQEMDTELPLALAESAAIPAKSVAEQVKEQQTAAAESTDTAPAASPGKASGKAPGKTSAKKPTKSATQSPVIKKLVKTAPKAKPAPAAPAPKAKAAVPKKPAKATASEAQEAKRAACLADLAAALDKHGDNLTRRIFAAEAKTGRSFETVFGSWDKFLDARAVEVNKAAVDTQQSASTSETETPPEAPAAAPAPLITPVPAAEAVPPAADPAPTTGTKAGQQLDLLGDPPLAQPSTLSIY